MDQIKKKFILWEKKQDLKSRDTLFCEIWDIYHPKLQVYVTNYMSNSPGSQQEAMDRASEILLHVFESIHNYNGVNSFSTWLYTLARNRMVDQLRKKQMTTAPLEDRDVRDPHTPETLMIKKSEQETVKDAVNRLSPSDRELIYLHYYEGLKYRAISEITGTPIGTIKYRMSESRKVLKKDLQGRGRYEKKYK